MALQRDELDSTMAWQRLAACKGPEAGDFFPPPLMFEPKEVRLTRERRAKAVCATCDVRVACREYALGTGEPHGVWGGLSESERRTILASRQAIA